MAFHAIVFNEIPHHPGFKIEERKERKEHKRRQSIVLDCHVHGLEI